MPEGTNTWKGLAVPLNGESEIEQIAAANDILTLTGASSQTGDFLVMQNSSGTELLYVDASGNLTTSGKVATPFVSLGSTYTVAPTTGLTKGDIFAVIKGTAPQLGICYSTATNAVRFATFNTETVGRLT
jgi:hypothetical protein